jgi:DNA invertase Pin-like site-specific DNA recombinase
MKPVDLYVRVSRVGGREHLISPDEQELRGRQLAEQYGLTVGEVVVDLDESGGKWERPGLQKALARVERGESGGVIVAWLDRLSRDSEHAHTLIRRIGDAGGRIYAPDAPSDWTSPEGELQAGILFAFASYIRKRAQAGFERAKERSIANGVPISSTTPVGYRRGPDRRLEPDPDVAPIVRRIFEARAEGAEPQELAAIFENAGITTARGSTVWTRQTLYWLLGNRVYLGELTYGKDGRFTNPAAHEPIVDLVTFQKAQAGSGPGRKPNRRYLLAGLLRCEACRYCMSGTPETTTRLIYRCDRRRPGGICPAPTRITVERVEAAVLADLFPHLPKLTVRGRGNRSDGKLDELAQRVARSRTALAGWSSPAIQAEVGDLDLYVAGLRERRQQLVADEQALAAEQTIDTTAHQLPPGMTWEQAWDAMTLNERVGLLATRYDCISLSRNPDRLIVYPIGAGPDDLPRRGYTRNPILRGFSDNIPNDARELTL